ncbi:ATP-binding protein [Limnobacter sp.]|jgi:signal transduction histidine kinase|uniref:ATP-binding protein n=1 Tax=Limnobacter sp. TaxID=2003368 RepID=UPI003919C9F3
MSFNITARTILHLGADLISSDAVALYELIKNAIDARSKDGVTVSIDIVIREPDFESVIALAHDIGEKASVEQLVKEFRARILSDAPEELTKIFEASITSASDVATLLTNARQAYRVCNRIVVSDTGDGMSGDDLKNIFLTIGTTNRTRAVNYAIEHVKPGQKSPYLGEKGVGRLSVMRLGRFLRVETATKDDSHVNILEIDWRRFEEAYDLPASSVKLAPTIGPEKALGESFTRITVLDLRANWTFSGLEEIAVKQIARIMDPFSWDERRRFPIKLIFNGQPVQKARTVANELLKNAHSVCRGNFTITNGIPSLVVELESNLYAGDLTSLSFDLTDLKSISGIATNGYPTSILESLGEFNFEFYWFNRQRLKAIEGIGDREKVRTLIRSWTGVSLFRDGYRVLPYGDEGDDWLGLDRDALAAGGYKLNTKQIVGRVRIGRLANPRLLDQTNRQGLTDTPEKKVLVALLHSVIARWWAKYLDEAGAAQKQEQVLSYDSVKESSVVEHLEKRTKESIKSISRNYDGDLKHLQEVKDAFLEIKDAHARAVSRIGTIEEEKERLTQLAGIGLMIEVIAHELTRATEATQKTLKTIKTKNVDKETAAAFQVLSQQIKVIQRRLHTLEPLSITARQRRSNMDIVGIIKYVLESHTEQFSRHRISISYSPTLDSALSAFVVEGHIVQILENLISNSVYWLDVERRDHQSFEPKIQIDVLPAPPRLRFTDNGPGIPVSRAESVFEPFFSTKSLSAARLQGLGLYIARQTAEMLGGTLTLVDEGNVRVGRFNTFELELRENSE